MTDHATRPARADARRNRRRILAAARAMVASEGLPLQMDHIAERAGVSVGTLYRHFASKDRLLGELVAEQFGGFASEMEVAWREVGGGREPFEALVAALWRCAEAQAGDQAVQDAILRAPGSVQQMIVPAVGNLRRITDRLLSAAIVTGDIRDDVTYLDIALLMTGVTATQSPLCPVAGPGDWRRHMRLAIDSLRPAGPRLPGLAAGQAGVAPAQAPPQDPTSGSVMGRHSHPTGGLWQSARYGR